MVPHVLLNNFAIKRQDDGNGNAYKRFPSGSFVHIGKTKGGGKGSRVEYLSCYLVTVGGNLLFPCPLL
jgi:hypothetical protein